MARVYATPQQYEQYTGQTPAPAGTEALLRQASRMLDRLVLRSSLYDADPTGMPTNAVVAAAFADATCAQAAWWDQVGDPSGADAVGWGSVGIGSVQLGRSVTAVSGEDAPARQLAPEVWDALLSPDLTPSIFSLNGVSS
ncbi:hypothetical protein ACWEPZ_02805 [Streptomyces sp. NPDC004288]